MKTQEIHRSTAEDKSSAPSPRYAFVNGQWWDGDGYRRHVMYSIDGVFKSNWSGNVDATVDLEGQYVIPPLAEAHNHWIEANHVDEMITAHLADGVFYVRDPSVSPRVLDQFIDKLNLPTSVDYNFAAQGFVAPGGHPSGAWDMLVDMGAVPHCCRKNYDPELLFYVTTVEDVDARFELLRNERTDYVKIFLQYSEEYYQRVGQPDMRDKYGVDPKLVPHIIKKSHEMGLPALAHVYTVTDYRAALYGGIDEMVHMPGLEYDPKLGKDHFLLTEEDARETYQRGVIVNPTIAFTTHMDRHDPGMAQFSRDEIVRPNLKLLKEHGVTLVVGSDYYGHTMLPEIFFMRETGVFTDKELLNMASTVTSQVIFPQRKIGALKDGYEASFLVLREDPAQNIDNIRTITLRVKQGRRLTVPESAINRPGNACFPPPEYSAA